MITIIKACSCVSEYQDEKYGKGQRVHNKGMKAGSTTCTVCNKKSSK